MTFLDPNTITTPFKVMDFINDIESPIKMSTTISKMSIDELQALRKNCENMATQYLDDYQMEKLVDLLVTAQLAERRHREQKKASNIPLPSPDVDEQLYVNAPPSSPWKVKLSPPEHLDRLAELLASLPEKAGLGETPSSPAELPTTPIQSKVGITSTSPPLGDVAAGIKEKLADKSSVGEVAQKGSDSRCFANSTIQEEQMKADGEKIQAAQKRRTRQDCIPGKKSTTSCRDATHPPPSIGPNFVNPTKNNQSEGENLKVDKSVFNSQPASPITPSSSTRKAWFGSDILYGIVYLWYWFCMSVIIMAFFSSLRDLFGVICGSLGYCLRAPSFLVPLLEVWKATTRLITTYLGGTLNMGEDLFFGN
ncbi:hypothetical protein HYFRA_00006903 [Hymenoscyphus fraxineus]|uniref:Uncharacterized protein n=1 Tax=Hymenoscyphus fraxineus TaxID=746836 RepID=A0A9N9KMC2_9HELO|nr:hypothetical protein HYFRA_00006903 [Hymenoscyphus fraxineus]